VSKGTSEQRAQVNGTGPARKIAKPQRGREGKRGRQQGTQYKGTKRREEPHNLTSPGTKLVQSVQYSTAHYSTVQYSTVQYITLLYDYSGMKWEAYP